MAISDRISSLRQRLSPSRQVEDERLLQLFWNRAELKKELVRLQVERDRLIEQHPALARFVPTLVYALDEEYVRDDEPVQSAKTLALIPPVSGG